MKKSLFAFVGALVLFVTAGQFAMAADYTCPSPDQVKCIPAQPVLGDWEANGGQMTGNTFAPNSQCANVIQLSPTSSRLLCCYVKCGVFIKDVAHRTCRKSDQSHFTCQ